MNATETKQAAAVMIAWAEGKKIQVRKQGGSEWADTMQPLWSWFIYDYRIAPEPMEVEVWAKPDGTCVAKSMCLSTPESMVKDGYTLRRATIHPQEQRQKINQFIAEKCGWTRVGTGWLHGTICGVMPGKCLEVHGSTFIPDYTADLNACAVAEEVLDGLPEWRGEEHNANAIEAFMVHLGRVTKTGRFADDWEMIHSTAEQRALALFNVMGGEL